MGLIKGKKILIDSNFTKDNYFTENTYFKALNSTSLPTTSADVQIHNSQPVFYSINTVLNRLLENDKFINRYLDCEKSTIVNKQQLISAYNENITKISSDIFEKAYDQHLKDYHDPDDPSQIHFDIIDKNYLKTDLTNFSEKLAKKNFMKGDKDIISSSNVVFENDFVTEVEFNDSTLKSSSYILASVSNSRTNRKFKYELPASQTGGMTYAIPTLASVPFIYRKWLSGIKEFFIYLPTTFTFYREGNGRGDNEGKDLNYDSTLIWLKFNKRHFDLHHIYSTQICGQSLPMQITMGSSGFFSDIMLPSIVRSLPISENTENNADSVHSQNTNYFQMLFSCYGTDAQAIRMVCD